MNRNKGSETVNREVNIVKKIVQDAIDTILSSDINSLHVLDKGRQDIVTGRDFEMERYIKKELLNHFPEDRFMGEEENHFELDENRTWVCDPIDGTVNYTMGIPYYGVQIALMEAYEPVFCLIALPELGQVYHAIKGEGAFVNDERITLDPSKLLRSSIVTFGDFSKSNPGSRNFQLKAIEALMEKAMRIRIQGASSVDFAFVASGKNGCHILFSKNLWELAPGRMLAESAGCATGTIPGEPYGFEGEGLIISGNSAMLGEVYLALETIPKKR
ncbi:MAG: inositol monophosphatase family protein [Clostridiales bacterium]|nr:inositol monophosphatase family protein [Clostridiales bacterium]